MMTRLRDQQGMIDLVLIIVVLVLAAGLGGYVVYRQHQAQQAYNAAGKGTTVTSHPKAKTPAQTIDPYAGWLTYKDSYITFKYPPDWTASKQYSFSDQYGAYSLNLVAPVDNSLVPADPSNKPLSLGANILIAKDGWATGGCAACGKIFAVESVTTNGTTGYLVIADSGVPGQPALIDLLKDNIAVGTAGYAPMGVRAGNKYSLRVSGDYHVGTLSLVGFKDVSSIKNSKEYIQLRNLIKTIVVQSSNLP